MLDSNNHDVEPVPDPPVLDRRTMLAPVAYSESVMPALRLARSSRTARRIAKVLSYTMLIVIALMAIAPWQQNVTGSGDVIALDPEERQQILGAPIKGRVERWGENIKENVRVKKGDFIVEIRDLDEDYAERLRLKVENSEKAVTASEEQVTAAEQVLEFANTVVKTYEQQLTQYESILEQTTLFEQSYVNAAEQKVEGEKELLRQYEAAIPQLEAEVERVRNLHERGNISLQKVQEVERKLQEAEAKVRYGERQVAAASEELQGKIEERQAKIDKANADIEEVNAKLRKARGDVSKTESDLKKVEQGLAKARQDLLADQTALRRQTTGVVTAPFDGFIVQIFPNQGSAVLKEGDPLFKIVPDTADRAVQIWLDGNDAPLVEPGRHVRLQFEGWPAIQFAGWPSVAVGTFGGEILSVDATDNGAGKFRVLVIPDPDSEPWPEERFLRQGVRTNGWVLLNRVPLWYEVWRQLNGFPPIVSMDKPSEDKPSKPPKLP